MRERDRRAVVLCCAFLFLFAVALAGLLISNGLGGQTLSSALALAVLTSLVTTAIASAAGVVWAATADPSSARPQAVTGLKRVAKKNALAPEDWLAILTSATREFYVAGHSLGRWCSASNRNQFTSHLSRILYGGGEVTLVMLGLDSPPLHRLQRATGIDYTDRVRQSMLVLTELRQSLPEDQSRRLTIAVLRNHDVIPYMVVGNEHRLITAAYLASTDNESTVCLELDRTSESGAAIYDDFRKLADKGS